jgi:GPH family glycoside/pentoside/hexuronide:cation symporter
MSKDSELAQAKRGRALSLGQHLTYAAGNFPVGFGPTVVSAWLAYYFYGRETDDGEPVVLVGALAFGTITLLCNVLNAFTDPAVGYLSDRTRSRWGRRKPWVLAGAPLLALSFFFLWTPPTGTESLANQVVLFASLLVFWFAFTVVVAPYLSLLPEITPYDDERVRISAFMGLSEILGTVFGSALWPVLTGMFAAGALFLATGEQVVAMTSGVAMVVLLALSVSTVRETYQPPTAEGERATLGAIFRELWSTFHNRAFIPYVIGVGFYRMAVATTVFIAPFLAAKVIAAYPSTEAELGFLGALGAIEEGGAVNWEAAAGLMMALVLLGAAAFFPLTSWLAGRVGKRTLFILALGWFGVVMIAMAAVGELPVLTPLFQGLALFLLASFPVSIAMVVMRPLLADVIDADEPLTGRRREGVYNGMEGFIMKVAAGLGPMLGGVLFTTLGHTVTDHSGVRACGPLAGICLLAAAAAFTRYPIRK